jgi:hypothetical protein
MDECNTWPVVFIKILTFRATYRALEVLVALCAKAFLYLSGEYNAMLTSFSMIVVCPKLPTWF